jgi:hypothetical protein
LAHDFAKLSVVLNGKNNRSRGLGTAESGLRSLGAVGIPTGNIDYEISAKLVSKAGAVFKLVV